MISTFLSYLSVIGVTTPMIGLTGTVTGMMRAFEGLGTEGIGDPSKLAGAIGEVLVATLSGLAIAVPAFMAFYFLRARMVTGIHHVQDIINDLFRKMPWEALQGAHIGDEELYAALPAWAIRPGTRRHALIAPTLPSLLILPFPLPPSPLTPQTLPWLAVAAV